MQKKWKIFTSVYEIQKLYLPPEANEKPKRKHRTDMSCRFCGGVMPQVSFRSDPHVISKLFEMNYGISDFECDICNNYFSAEESHMAHFLGLKRPLDSIGQDKVPSFVSPGKVLTAKMFEVFPGQKAIEISDLQQQNFKFDPLSGKTDILCCHSKNSSRGI
ncbi:hypothetical protein ACUN24_20605 [Pedobacter sp. WC2501]|uniref:hypothetical protein n=1 Tax=Pedobacter sp. WC2501 TaxID=3461400 RepID=UPI0040451C86